MPGKMTVLDRLIKEGRVKQAPFREMKLHGEFTDPMIKARANQQLAGNKLIKVDPSWKTPERKVYQRGIEARLYPKKIAADEAVDEAYNLKDEYEDEWRDAVEEAKENMKEDWESSLDYASFDDVDPYYLEVDAPSTDLGEYWPGSSRTPEEIADSYNEAEENYYKMKDAQRYIYGPEAIMREQTMTPRYRNYQRAMQQRAANMAMGRDLSRRYAIAYNNLLRRGLTPVEARMYMREYFGGR